MSTDNQNNPPPTPQDSQPHPNPAAFIADLLEDCFDGPEVEVVAKALRYLGVGPVGHRDDSIVVDYEPEPRHVTRQAFNLDGWRMGEDTINNIGEVDWPQGSGPTLIHALAAAWDDYQSKRDASQR